MKNCSGIILGAVFIILAPLINSNRNLGTATSTALLGSLTSEIHEELRWGVRPPQSRMLTLVVDGLYVYYRWITFLMNLVCCPTLSISNSYFFSRKFLKHC
jgi:uncharacterized membrane protein (UPF0136 family)